MKFCWSLTKCNIEFMKLIFALLFLITIAIGGWAQEKRFVIKFSPLALIDEISFPTIQGSIEYKLSKNLSWHNEIGIKYRKGYYEGSDTSFINSSGYKVKTELRYYLSEINETLGLNKSFNGFYLGGNIFFNRDCHNSQLGYYQNNDSSTLVIDNFGVKKSSMGMNFIIGLQQTVYKHFLIDLYAGLGFRIRNIDNLKREYDPDRDSIDGPIDVTIQAIRDNIDVTEGISGTVNLTLGFRDRKSVV